MGAIIPTYEELLRSGVNMYYNKYQKKPTTAGCAPGRVNIIGEHVDYNGGFVFPIALPMVTMVIGAENNTNKIRLYTDADVKEECISVFKIPYEVELIPGEPIWANYVKGTISYFPEAVVPGFDAVIISSIPLDSGLGGSSALEVATYNFLEQLTETKTNLKLKAILCQKAEHTFALHPCGIMDQFAAIFAVKGYALLLDCLNLNFNEIPFGDPDVEILIVHADTVRKTNASTKFSNRRDQCYTAAKIMNLDSLREGGTRDLQKYRPKMHDDLFRRARHVITEINRTIDAAQSLKFKDYTSFGLLMLQSHNSLSVHSTSTFYMDRCYMSEKENFKIFNRSHHAYFSKSYHKSYYQGFFHLINSRSLLGSYRL